MKISLPLFVAVLIVIGTFAGLTVARMALRNSLQLGYEEEQVKVSQSIQASVQDAFESTSRELTEIVQKQAYSKALSNAVKIADRFKSIEEVLQFSTQNLPLASIKTYINRENQVAWIDDAEFYSPSPPDKSLINAIEPLIIENSTQLLALEVEGEKRHVLVMSAEIPDTESFTAQGQLRTVFDVSPSAPFATEVLSKSKADCIRIYSNDGIDIPIGDPECTQKLYEAEESYQSSEKAIFVLEDDFLLVSNTISSDYQFAHLKFASGSTTNIISAQSQQLASTLKYVVISLILTGFLTTTIALYLTRRSVGELLTFIGQDLTKDTKTFSGSYISELETIAKTHQAVTENLRKEMLDRAKAEGNVEILSDKVRSAHSDKMEALGTLTAGVAHDFNNLLAIIIGNLELFREDSTAIGGQDQRINDIFDSSNRAAALVSDLLQYSRNEPFRKEIHDVREIITSMRKIIAAALGPRIELRYVIDDNTTYLVSIDADKCTAAILNLVTNARDAMPEGGILTISMKKGSEVNEEKKSRTHLAQHCIIEIEDTGTGIDDDKLRQIFNPFFTTKAPGKGTGLGLALVHSFVEQSHGHIDISSQTGKGTKFTISLPTNMSCPVNVSPSAKQKEIKGSLAGVNILILDDEVALCRVIEMALKTTGANIQTAYFLKDAIEILKSKTNGHFDVIISDIILADGYGTDILEKCKQYLGQTEIIFMSGNSSMNECKTENDKRAAFIQKPFQIAKLISEVQSVLR